ncbi:two-component regulator propeller domain-containing protein [Pseudopedobacter sp.]|uniref:hybrid sensor histidine kinase/response regulator transcription factor n=1 Tax=Pseudopedobacter sp. TaxID=1936787 RepID=UPI0033413122
MLLQPTFAQNLNNIPEDFKFQHFTSANGLSQRSVMAIIQDRKGYLWFGTRDGLNKFDGNKFIIYRHDLNDTNSLSNNNIHSIYEDSYGNLWIGTQIGLNKYNPKTDQFIRYKHSEKQSNIADHIVRGIVQINRELIWAATDNGIIEINIHTNAIKRIQKQHTNANSLSGNQSRYLLKTKEGNIWICNTRYIDIYNPTKKTFKRLDYPKKNSNNIHLNDLPTLYVDQKNRIWLGYEQGLALYDTKTKGFVDFEFNGKKAISTAVRSICEDPSGNLWIGSYSGLYILNPAHSQLKHIVHDENNSNSLSQNSIYKIIRDSRGDMWLGTWADGLNYYNRDNGAFKNISFGNTSNKLNYRVVSGIAEDATGNLWIGTEGGGLNFYDKATKRFNYYKNDPNNSNSLSANNVKSVIIDRDENIWIGIHDGGLNFLNPRKRPFEFKTIDFPKNNNVLLKGYKVLTLLEDKNGNIWIGTLTGGLIFYDVSTKILSKIDRDIKSIMSIVQTEDSDVLLIGGDNGLETINITTKRREKIPLKKTTKEDSPLYVNCIFVDNFNNYWIGTEGEGVYLYDPKTKKARSYGIKDGLPNDIIYGILSDNNGNIWISTNNGISRLNVESNSIKNYNQLDGLQGNEFNYGSFYKTKDRELFFGGTNGLTYFDPNDIRKNTFVPEIDITNIEVNNAPYTKITDSVLTITLKYNENNFSIDFTALSYMHPEKNEFTYILEGNDKEWNYVGNQRKAVYTNIKEGNYVFRVKGANNDGVWNEEGDFIKIKILPAPWKTWWAYLLYLTLLSGIFLYIRKLTLLRIKERKEKEKSEQISQLRLSLFTDISHDFRTPLTLIIGPLEKMMSKNMGDSYIQQQHGIMLKNSKMLLQLVNQILDFRKSESGKLTLQASKSNIVPFVQEIKRSFDSLAEKKNINYQLVSNSENIQVWFDKSKMKNILFNLLSNAFKFSDDHGEVTIHISTLSKKLNSKLVNYVKISVVNFGYVIPEEYTNLIFDQFYQIDNQKKNLGSGIGLSLTKRLVELHKGKITVKSSVAEGTRFSIILRLGNEHLAANERIEEIEPVDENNSFYIDTELNSLQQTGQNLQSIEPYQDELQSLLIVEDNLDLQNFIKNIFTSKYNVFVAENGEQAILLAQQNPIELIISDIQMPVMDGFALCNNIKNTLMTSHIPVILLTAKTSHIHQEKGYQTGADAYITKPFNADILEVRVNNLLTTRANLIRKFKKDAILEPKELTVTSPDEIFLEKAIAVVEKNITSENFNTSMFIDQMNMSRTVIYTKLKALTGQNISTFIRTIRLKKAGQLISQTKMNVSEIAYQVGFNDLKYFRECFKEFFKVTPSEYKKNNSNNKSPAN